MSRYGKINGPAQCVSSTLADHFTAALGGATMHDQSIPASVPEQEEAYGLLTVISLPWMERGRSRVRVRCACDAEFTVRLNSLKTGNTTSCGCARTASLHRRNTTHGLAPRSGRHPLYKAWSNIVQRCTNPTHPKYADYGGRGITVCDAWRDSFEQFLTDVGERPWPGAEIDRRDNSRGYEPDNIRWVTRREQNSNKRNNQTLSHNGQSMTLTAWAELLRWSRAALDRRVARMPLAEALTPNPKPKQVYARENPVS